MTKRFLTFFGFRLLSIRFNITKTALKQNTRTSESLHSGKTKRRRKTDTEGKDLVARMRVYTENNFAVFRKKPAEK